MVMNMYGPGDKDIFVVAEHLGGHDGLARGFQANCAATALRFHHAFLTPVP